MNAQDWAQLDRYKKANLTLDLDTVDMVFMGDSITEVGHSFAQVFSYGLFAEVLADKRHRNAFAFSTRCNRPCSQKSDSLGRDQ